MVTRWAMRLGGSSGTRGRGGTLTVCLLVNLSFWCWDVIEGEGVEELWRRRAVGESFLFNIYALTDQDQQAT